MPHKGAGMGLSSELPRAAALCIPRLYEGGAEKVMAHMAGWWAERGVHVHLVTFHASPRDFPLHPAVRRTLLDDVPDAPFPRLDPWPRESRNVGALRQVFLRILREEGVERLPVLSFLARMNMRCLFAAQGLPCRVVISERTYPPALFLGEHDEALRRQSYPLADALVVQTEYTRQHWGNGMVGPAKCHALPNACLPQATPPQAIPLPEGQDFFLAIGRLAPEKRHDMLLRAFAETLSRFPRLHLYLAGSGELERPLRELCRQLHLEKRTTFLGHVADVRPWLRQARAIVHPSEFEGFPNVLLEALAERCPMIATDCLTGPSEIIRQGQNGFLVPVNDQTALTDAMLRILDADVQRAFRENMRVFPQEFSADGVMRAWTRLLSGRRADASAPAREA